MAWGQPKIYIPLGMVLIALAGLGLWLGLIHQSAVVNPFDAKTLAGSSFPLYYPTEVPKNYRIDPKSVTTPQAGVIGFSMKGRGDSHIYMSQETRPSTFNFGGYYQNFKDLMEKVTPMGTIAVGRINGGATLVGSLATNKSWLIVNTNARDVQPQDITNLLNSLVASH